jgi:hypothetical protein
MEAFHPDMSNGRGILKHVQVGIMSLNKCLWVYASAPNMTACNHKHILQHLHGWFHCSPFVAPHMAQRILLKRIKYWESERHENHYIEIGLITNYWAEWPHHNACPYTQMTSERTFPYIMEVKHVAQLGNMMCSHRDCKAVRKPLERRWSHGDACQMKRKAWHMALSYSDV